MEEVEKDKEKNLIELYKMIAQFEHKKTGFSFEQPAKVFLFIRNLLSKINFFPI